MTEERVWHYTTYAHLEKIAESGNIQPSSIVTEGERPVVWLTSKPDWEETANKMIQNVDTGELRLGTRKDTQEVGGGLVRIEVESVSLLSWEAFKSLSGISEKMAEALEVTAREQGSDPGDWWVSFDPIPVSEWIQVDGFHENVQEWRPLFTRPEAPQD